MSCVTPTWLTAARWCSDKMPALAWVRVRSRDCKQLVSSGVLTGARAAQATCSAPYCLDMRNYPMFRNGACMCATQTLAHVRELAIAARNQSTLAAVGARSSNATCCLDL